MIGIRTYDRRTRDEAGAFLVGELERLDTTFNAPLTEVTWQRDIDLREDIAMEDEVAAFTVTDFAAAGFAGKGKSWIGSGSTAIGGVDINTAKIGQPLHLWGREIGFSTIEAAKAQRLNRPIDTQKYDAMQMKYQLDVDEMVYMGDGVVGATGLLNNTAIPPMGLSADWSTATPAEILADVNLFLTHAWTRSAYTVAPDQLRLPPEHFALLLQPVSSGGSISILEYVSKMCVSAAKNGRDLEILPLKWSVGAGVGGLDRAVAYTRSKRYLRFPLVPVQKTPLEVRGLQHLTVYYGLLGWVEFVYPETVSYGDLVALGA
ncbi:DUF2184 domain-containing protein [Rhodospirillum sp. A1_3_36]|uniref:DUF2184 domain-containing protein n=1 Tax=Rhodospirillum sp. A1_3_36 TaxID=3391666 RepID=UPI0039A56689